MHCNWCAIVMLEIKAFIIIIISIIIFISSIV